MKKPNQKADHVIVALSLTVEVCGRDDKHYSAEINREILLTHGQAIHDRAVDLLVALSEAHNKMLTDAGLCNVDEPVDLISSGGGHDDR